MIIPKLDLSNTPSAKTSNCLVYGKNIVLDNRTIRNEPGFDLEAKCKYYYIGSIVYPTGEVIFSTDNINTEIAIVSNGVKTVILDSAHIGCNRNSPIEGVAKYNNRGEIIATWWDGINATSNKPCILNLNNLPFPSGVNSITHELNNTSEINFIYTFPDYAQPIIEVQSVTNGGSLRQAKYSFCIAYEIDDTNITNFTLPSRDIYVANNEEDSDFVGYEFLSLHVSDFGDVTNKAISLVISNLDTRFKSFKLAVIRKEGLNVSFELAGRFQITSSSTSIIYSGEVLTSNITIKDITDKVVFDRVETGTFNNRRLALGNVKTRDSIDYQKYANNIKIGWTTSGYDTINTEGGYLNENGKVTFYYKGFTPDEVYAFYIHWIFTDGTISEGFHIPGRIPTSIERTQTYVPGSSHDDAVNPNQRVFHLRDTSTIDAVDANGHPYGIMGAWENETELYKDDENFDIWGWDGSNYRNLTDFNPVIYPTLRNTKVRHHKFPDAYTINTAKKVSYSGGVDPTPVGCNIKRVLGISLSDVSLPNEIANDVVGFTISFAKRSFDNQTVFAFSDLHSTKWYDAPPRNDTNYRIHDFALLSQKPYLDVSYIKALYVIDNNYKITDHPYYYHAGVLIDNVSTLNYVPADNSAFIPTNSTQEGYIDLKLVDPGSCTFAESTAFLGPVAILPNQTYTFIDPASTDKLTVGSLHAFRLNVFNPFYEQELVSTGYIFDKSLALTTISSITTSDGDVKRIHGGDTFMSQELIAYYRGPFTGAPGHGTWVNWGITRYSAYNYQYRSKPTDGFHWIDPVAVEKNDYDFNIEWSKFVEVKQGIAFNPYGFRTNSFPNRIVRSQEDLIEGAAETWRTFYYNEYYEMVKTKGPIRKLDTSNKTLIIRCEHSMYVAKLKDQIDTLTGQLNVAPGDIFDREPDEIVPDDKGLIGCSSKWCGFTFEYGYLAVDRRTKRIFILNNEGQLSNLHDKDVNKFLDDNLNTSYDLDNPFALMGLVSTYDSKFDRILITKVDTIIPNFKGEYSKDVTYAVGDTMLVNGVIYICDVIGHITIYTGTVTDNSFTFQYNLKADAWLCFHDYIPIHMFYNRNGAFAVNNNNIYKINSKTKRGIYFDGLVYPSYFDIIFNEPKGISKFLEFINWDTLVIDNGVKREDLTITQVMVYNDTQCSGILQVTINPEWFNVSNGKNANGIWHYSEFEDCVVNNKLAFFTNMVPNSNVNKLLIDWFNRSRFIDKYFVVRLQYDNRVLGTDPFYQNDIWFNDCSINIQKSTF